MWHTTDADYHVNRSADCPVLQDGPLWISVVLVAGAFASILKALLHA